MGPGYTRAIGTTSFRPQVDSRYVPRPRLLEQLPDEAGFVVLLEAPYGYGKSVLASQWAERLERESWRVVWLAAGGSEPRALLATALELPASTPWRALLDTLWTDRTLLVLEDIESLDDHEALVPLLRDVRGLLLLASRVPLRASELPRLLTSGRLTQLHADDLGFTESEAAGLFDDAVRARRLWSRANGWPLPLHFASLTGDLPEEVALLSGMKASLSEQEWTEALLLATLPQLPAEAAVPATARLSATGFVQLGESGYRLHALVAESMVNAYRQEALAALEMAQQRLPKLLYGEALERLGEVAGLAELLEAPRSQLHRQAPEAFLRWDAKVAAPPTALRHITAGSAHKVLGQHREATIRLRAGLAADSPRLLPDDEVFALKELCWSLALVDADQVAEVIARGEALLDRVDPELAGRFLSDSSFVDIVRQDYSAASVKLERALAVMPEDSPFRSGMQINLALNRWDEHGDYDGRLAAQMRTLPSVWRLYPSDAPGQCRDIAMLYAWAGDLASARSYLEEAVRGERSNPLVGLEARAALAALDGEVQAFPGLLETAKAWSADYTIDAIAMYAIDALPPGAPLAEAMAYYQQVPAPALATAAYARRLAQHGSEGEALGVIDAALVTYSPRGYRLFLLAARYAVTRSAADLEALQAVTTAGARLLPGLVPIEQLPRDRPELARHYPLDAVLSSGWKDAIALRLEELPDLELRLLGANELLFAGRKLELTDRHKQLIALFTLGLTREEVAEAVWPEVDQAKQRNNMGVQISLMRRVLEPWGVPAYVHEDGLRRVRSDHAELLRALAAGDAERVSTLYQEPFAAGLTLDVIEEHRSSLRERVVSLLCEAAEAAAPARAVTYLSRVLELDPLNEEALRSLLQRLMERGRVREAQRRFAEFKRRLSDELGLEPLPETLAALEPS